MKKILLIGFKDLRLAFRDRAALILMLAAPFLLTLGLGFVSGRLSGGSASGISQIPVAIINQDGGQLGYELVNVFQSEDLSDLIQAELTDDETIARQQVDQDQIAAVVVIPAGFTDSIIPAEGAANQPPVVGPLVKITVVQNPSRPNSSAVVKAIVDEFISQVEVGRIGGQVTVTQLISHGLLSLDQAAVMGEEIGSRQSNQQLVSLRGVSEEEQEPAADFDVLAYMAPGMALMFLMYTVSNGGRSLLAERAQGTLPRLLVSPTNSAQVLGGKIFGIFMTGVAQMLILVLASAQLFGLQWGSPLEVFVLILACVVGAVGWGLLITALARTPGQVSVIGSAVMLTFGILGGSFINTQSFPGWFQLVSRLTPNAWGLDGFTTLALGGSWAEIGGTILALVVMGAVLFAISVVILNRRGMAE